MSLSVLRVKTPVKTNQGVYTCHHLLLLLSRFPRDQTCRRLAAVPSTNRRGRLNDNPPHSPGILPHHHLFTTSTSNHHCSPISTCIYEATNTVTTTITTLPPPPPPPPLPLKSDSDDHQVSLPLSFSLTLAHSLSFSFSLSLSRIANVPRPLIQRLINSHSDLCMP